MSSTVTMGSSVSCAEAPEATPLENTGIGKIKVTYFDGLQSRGLAIAACLTCSGLDYDWNKMPFEEFVGGGKAKLLWGYLPEVEVDGSKFSEVSAILAFIAQNSPNSPIGTKGADFGKSLMISCKTADLWGEAGNRVPHGLTIGSWSKEQTTVLEEFEKGMMKDYVDKFELLLDENGKITSTGTSFGEVFLWAFLYQMQNAKVSNVVPMPPKLRKLCDRCEALTEIKQVLAGEAKCGKLAQWYVPVPERQ